MENEDALNGFHFMVKSNLKAGGIWGDLKLFVPWVCPSVCPTSGHEEVSSGSPSADLDQRMTSPNLRHLPLIMDRTPLELN